MQSAGSANAELLGRIQAAAERDSDVRSQIRHGSRLGRSRLFASAGREAEEAEEEARLRQLMEGARRRLDVSDEANLALLASEIVDRSLNQPSVYSPGCEGLRVSAAPPKPREGTGSAEWQLYQQLANQGVPLRSPAVDGLRNQLSTQLYRAARQGASIERALQQLGDAEHAARLEHQAQLGAVAAAAAEARRAVEQAERSLTEQLNSQWDGHVSALRQGMVARRSVVKRLQHSCGSARRLLSTFHSSQRFSGTLLEPEAGQVCAQLQQAAAEARVSTSEAPELMQMPANGSVDLERLRQAIVGAMVLGEASPLEREQEQDAQLLQFEATAVIPISIWPLKRSTMLQSLAAQLRVELSAIAVQKAEPAQGCIQLTIGITSSSKIVHAAALASLDVMRAEASHGNAAWGHVSISRVCSLRQRPVRLALPARTFKLFLGLEAPEPRQFELEAAEFLDGYAEAAGAPPDSIRIVRVCGPEELGDVDRRRAAGELRSVLELADSGASEPDVQGESWDRLGLLLEVKLAPGRAGLSELTGEQINGWLITESATDGRPARVKPAAVEPAAEPAAPPGGAPPAWADAIQELQQAKSAAVKAEEFKQAHQLKGQIEELQQQAPSQVHLLLTPGRLGLDWEEQLATDVSAALACEQERVKPLSAEIVDLEDARLEIIAVQLAPGGRGDPSPSELRLTFAAQLKNRSSRLYQGVLSQHLSYEPTVRWFYGGDAAGRAEADLSVEGFVALAKSIFDEFDADCSCEIDESELSGAIQSLWTKLGTPLSPSELDAEVVASLRKFDKDGSGTLDFPELMAMLCEQPWIELLPREMRAQAPKVVEQLRGAAS